MIPFIKQKLHTLLYTPVSPQSLGAIRIQIGILLALWCISQIYYDFVSIAYTQQSFSYPLIPQIASLINYAYTPYFFILMLISAIALILGKYWPLPALTFLIGYIPIFARESTYYQDYRLAIIILLIGLSLTHCTLKTQIHRWQILFFQSLFLIILSYKSIALFNTDFLSGNTLKELFPYFNPTLFHQNLTLFKYTAWAVWASLLASILIPLFYKKMLPLVWLLLGFFSFYTNIPNNPFNTDYLGYMLLILSTVWLPPTWPSTLISTLKTKIQSCNSPTLTPTPSPLKFSIRIILSLYILIQLLVPLKFYIPEDEIWYQMSPQFAWTMKLVFPARIGHFVIVDPLTNTQHIEYLQKDDRLTYGLSILRKVTTLKEKYTPLFNTPPEIYAHIHQQLTPNAPFYPYTKETINLATLPYSTKNPSAWLYPYPPKTTPTPN